MKRGNLIYLILGLIIMGAVIWAVSNKVFQPEPASLIESMPKDKIREPAVAGSFYPADKESLTEQIDQFLEAADLPVIEGQIKALIVPHAGYVYSGPVATYGYKALIGQDIQRVILVGSSHHQFFSGVALNDNDFWQTPLGQVAIDKELRDKLVQAGLKIDSSAHQPEHSLEVQVPFLQRVLKDFKILPILIGQADDKDLEKLAEVIVQSVQGLSSKRGQSLNTLIIASTDFSHYPAYEKAVYADNKVIQAILTGQVENLKKTIADLEKENIPQAATFLCGQMAVEVVMKVAQKLGISQIELLKYANSGDVPIGDKSQVVGYGAIAFIGSAPAVSEEQNLNKDQQKKLLEIAQTSVETYIRQNQLPSFETDDPLLNQFLGAFVTLRKHAALRGCIGRFTTEDLDLPLYQVVSQMAVAAATQDNRFLPVQANELDELEYEISVLSPLRKIDNWQKIEIGKHGVQVQQGSHSGVFLPQVATENNWGLEEFMGNLCQNKAGLSRDAWKTSQVDLYIFTAQIFGDE